MTLIVSYEGTVGGWWCNASSLWGRTKPFVSASKYITTYGAARASVSHHEDIQTHFCLTSWPDRTRGRRKKDNKTASKSSILYTCLFDLYLTWKSQWDTVSHGRTVLKNGSPVQIGNTERSDPNQHNTKHQTADRLITKQSRVRTQISLKLNGMTVLKTK